MERMIDAETEELSKREKYRERRGEEYDVVSKVAFLNWRARLSLEEPVYGFGFRYL